MSRATRYPQEVRERAVRMVLDHTDQYSSQWEAMGSIEKGLAVRLRACRTKFIGRKLIRAVEAV